MTSGSSRLRIATMIAGLGLCLGGTGIHAAEIAYLSSSSGYMLHEARGQAVTSNWAGQQPLQGFNGYGAVRQANKCLTGRGPAGQALTWDRCQPGDRNQAWALSSSRLVNEAGWCADVEGNRGGAGVRVVAWQCSGASNQRWKAHLVESADARASRMADQAAANRLRENAARAPAGRLIDLRTGELIGVDGGTMRKAAGAQVGVTAGGGKLIAAGGLN